MLTPARPAAQTAPEPALKAAFLLNFARFTEWPPDALPAGGPIVFCSTDAEVAAALQAAAYRDRYRVLEDAAARVVVKNRANGTRNPHAELRQAVSAGEVLASPLVAWPLKALETPPLSDGACALVLARGERDIVCDTALKPYDILALVPIIEGAGGSMVAWDGAPITLTHYATAMACGDATLAIALKST